MNKFASFKQNLSSMFPATAKKLVKAASVEQTGKGTRNINSVKAHPELEMVGNPDNVKFVNKTEHLLEHQGNFRNPTEGPLIYRKY